jgi:hypothetical protein
MKYKLYLPDTSPKTFDISYKVIENVGKVLDAGVYGLYSNSPFKVLITQWNRNNIVGDYTLTADHR